MQKSKETFWAVSKEYEKYLELLLKNPLIQKKKKKTSGKLAIFVKYENSR